MPTSSPPPSSSSPRAGPLSGCSSFSSSTAVTPCSGFNAEVSVGVKGWVRYCRSRRSRRARPPGPSPQSPSEIDASCRSPEKRNERRVTRLGRSAGRNQPPFVADLESAAGLDRRPAWIGGRLGIGGRLALLLALLQILLFLRRLLHLVDQRGLRLGAGFLVGNGALLEARVLAAAGEGERGQGGPEDSRMVSAHALESPEGADGRGPREWVCKPPRRHGPARADVGGAGRRRRARIAAAIARRRGRARARAPRPRARASGAAAAPDLAGPDHPARPPRRSIGIGADRLAAIAGPQRHHTWYWTLFLRNRTDPSAKQILIPPG